MRAIGPRCYLVSWFFRFLKHFQFSPITLFIVSICCNVTSSGFYQLVSKRWRGVSEQHAEQAVKIITSVMEQAAEPVMKMKVPLVAEAGIADSWSEAH